MKDLNLLIWLTQLGFSVILPLAGFLLLALWLRNNWGWGDWVIVVGILLGITSAVSGFRGALDAMNRTPHNSSKQKEEPPLSFNDHD
ncbi:MAG: AtpZ/AtpI family protein [Oscillospiraceae bacterium]|nr:AtpZ/AtpI family protein [Oscillospiraceae bacterium]